MPHAIEGARTRLATLGLKSCSELVAGSFFERVPDGADGYLLKNIIHDWDDEQSSLILRNCRRAIPDHGKLLLIERVMPALLKPQHIARSPMPIWPC
jgi:O-methyltransferase domain